MPVVNIRPSPGWPRTELCVLRLVTSELVNLNDKDERFNAFLTFHLNVQCCYLSDVSLINDTIQHRNVNDGSTTFCSDC